MDFFDKVVRKNLLWMDISEIDSFIEGYSAHIFLSGSGPSESAIVLPLLEAMIPWDGDIGNHPVWQTFQEASLKHLNTQDKIVIMAFIYRWISYMLSRWNDYFGDGDMVILKGKLEILQNQIHTSIPQPKANDVEIIELLLESWKTMTTKDRFKDMIRNAADSAMKLIDSHPWKGAYFLPICDVWPGLPYILVLHNSINIVSTFIHFLPTDRIHWAGSNRVIDIVPFIVIEVIHTGEALIIECEHITRNSGTCTASDASTIYVGFSEFSFESIDRGFIHNFSKKE